MMIVKRQLGARYGENKGQRRSPITPTEATVLEAGQKEPDDDVVIGPVVVALCSLTLRLALRSSLPLTPSSLALPLPPASVTTAACYLLRL